MKKLLTMILVAAMTMSLAACGGESIAGAYRNVTFLTAHNHSNGTDITNDDAIILDEDGSFIRYTNLLGPFGSGLTLHLDDINYAGTYTKTEDGFELQPDHDKGGRKAFTFEGTKFRKYQNYYYEYDGMGFLSKDQEGNPPVFDENGRSNQTFDTFYHTVFDSADTEESIWDVLWLSLKEDGTFNMSDYPRRVKDAADATKYEGTYTLEDGVLNLDCGNQVMHFLYLDNCIYFMVYEKVAPEAK